MSYQLLKYNNFNYEKNRRLHSHINIHSKFYTPFYTRNQWGFVLLCWNGNWIFHNYNLFEMPIDISKINPRGKLKHLIAKDMFEDESKQVFDAKSGKYLGIIKEGEAIPEDAQIEALLHPERHINPAQLNLF